MNNTHSVVSLRTVEKFRMARYTVISADPENDAAAHMENWAKYSGLLSYPGYLPKRIGWNFPFVTEEQTQKYGLRGYVAAYVIPQDFEPACEGAELADRETDRYACVTVEDLFSAPFEKITEAYQNIFQFLKERHYEIKSYENSACFEFEEVYEKDGVTYMDIYVPVNL